MRIVATWARWAAGCGALSLLFVAALEAYVTWAHDGRTLAAFVWVIAAFVAGVGAIVFALLRSEEARLARELRTARTGTSVARGLVARRRQRAPFFARLFSTRLGEAAVLLAGGDRAAAVDAMAKGSMLMQGGRLARLQEVVDADAERARGGEEDLARSVKRLRAMLPTGHRETDLYRLHVWVKALLEQGDAEGAFDLARDLAGAATDLAADDEARVYEAWLRVWFDLDANLDDGDPPWLPLGEGTLRMATLLARAQGGEKLVEMLEGRIARIDTVTDAAALDAGRPR